MLKELKELGITQQLVATKMGVTRQQVGLWFTGANMPSAKNVIRLADALTALTGKKYSPAKVFTRLTELNKNSQKAKKGARNETNQG